MCVASADLLIAVPLNIWLIVRTAEELLPWISRDLFYEDWHHVGQVPAAAWLLSNHWVVGGVLPRYLFPTVAFAFFALIGVTEESVGEYLRLFRYIRRLTGLATEK